MPRIVVIQPAGLTDTQLAELRKLGDVTYNEQFFDQTKNGVVFVTVTSKKMIDMPTLLDRLESGKIKHFITDNAQALLFDVTDADYRALQDNPNVTITPHVSAYSDNTQETAANMCQENIKAYLAGKPINLVGEA